jgi:spermidine synthase
MIRPIQLLVSLLFLLSGATALVYQITWVRNLTLIFGASFQATSIVLASFMAGLCLGGFFLGRYSGRVVRPLRTYALLEIGIAACAVALPSLLNLADAAYVQVALAAGGVTPSLNVVRFALAFGILVLPTFLMGATLPVLTEAFVGRYAEFGSRLSWLYGINTLGAVVGTVATGFFLIPRLGVWHSQLLAAAINVGIGLVALAIDWRWRTLPARLDGTGDAGDVSPKAAGAVGDPPPPLEPADRLGAQLAYRGAAVAGMCALALEVMWTRAVSISVGTTTYSFTVMLASFLTGIWLGSWLHAVMPLRRIRPHVQLGLVMLIIGSSSALASYWIPRLPSLVLQLNVALYGVQARILPGTTLLAGFVVMLIPCIFMGISFPLAGQARASLGAGFGRSAGDTLGWNTLGSIVGSLLAGFVLIPLMGLQRGMLLVAGAYAGYACLVLGAPVVAGLESRRWRAAAATSIPVVAALSLAWWVPPWDVRTMGAFENNQLARYVSGQGDVDVPGSLEDTVVVYYREGQASTVSVVEMRRGGRGLLVNGKTIAADYTTDVPIQALLGHIPVLTHPDPKTALVIGLGTGFTLGGLTAHSSLDEITLVEIEPAVIGAQPMFAAVNGDPLSDPRLRVYLQDGRNYLRTTPDRFDVITADPIHPWNQGSGYLFTAEYYRIARARLKAGGIMCQWLPTYGLSIENFRSIVATFDSVFPHTILWQNGYEALLIGSRSPFRIEFEELARRLTETSVAEQLAFIGLDDPHAFMAELALDAEQVRVYAAGGIINRDDNLYLEFSSPLSIGTRDSLEIVRMLNSYRNGPRSGPALLIASDAQRERIAQSREAKSQTLQIGLLPSQTVRILKLRKLMEEVPDFGPARLVLSIELVALGTAQHRAGKVGLAARSMRQAVELQPSNQDAQLGLGVVLLQQGRFQEAIVHLERALELRPNRWSTHAHLSRALVRAGRVPEAVESLRTAVAINPNDPVLTERLTRLTNAL